MTAMEVMRWARRAVAGVVTIGALAQGAAQAQQAPPPDTATVLRAQAFDREFIVFTKVGAAGQPVSAVAASELELTVRYDGREHPLEITAIEPLHALPNVSIVYVFLVDLSVSTNGRLFDAALVALNSWKFDRDDRLQMVVFGEEVRNVFPGSFPSNRQMSDALDDMARDQNFTRLYEAMALGVDIAGDLTPKSFDRFGREHVVLISVTDGVDDLTNLSSDPDYDARRAAARAVAESRIAPIYALAFPVAATPAEAGVRARDFREIVRLSGGDVVEVSDASVTTGVSVMQQRVLSTLRVRATCRSCPPFAGEGQVAVAVGGGVPDPVRPIIELDISGPSATPPSPELSVTEAPPADAQPPVEVIPPPTTPIDPTAQQPPADEPAAPPPDETPSSWIYYALGGVVALVGGALIWLGLRRRPAPTVATPAPAPPPPAAPTGPVVKLVTIRGVTRGEEIERRLGSQVVIGSDAACEISIPQDPELLPQHAALRADGDGVVVVGLSEEAVVLVNGVPVRAPRAVSDGDTISVGRSLFRLLLNA